MTNVIMPQMGESVTEGVITSWYKQLGEWVEKDESLLSITTDKVDADVPSPAAGFLTTIGFGEGETVAIDTVIAVLSESAEGEARTEAVGAIPNEASTPVSSGGSDAPSQAAPAQTSLSATASKAGAEVDDLRRSRSSPLVRKMAAEHGVDVASLQGSGVSGRVTKRDFEAYVAGGEAATPRPTLRPALSSPQAQPAPQPLVSQSGTTSPNRFAYKPTANDRMEPFSPMRSQIAEHMIISRETSVHVTTVFEVDMTRIAKLRAKHRKTYEAKGVKLSFMPFIIKAVASAIAAYPVMNSAVVDRSVAYRSDVNIGMAVALDWGLLVPVIRGADEKSLLGLARSVGDLAERAREKKLVADDLQGGTFTVTNPGVFGSLFGTPIINQPQVAILCVGTITKRAVVIEDDAIAVRQMMYLSLSFDHRVIDGATGDRFMKLVKDTLEGFSEDLI